MRKRVEILVGLPGSGKSGAAADLKVACEAIGNTCEIHSTDDYFVDSWGEYKFDPSKLSENHELNRSAFERSLESDVDVGVVDNTNLRRLHRDAYVELALEYGYAVQFTTIGSFGPKAAYVYSKRNVHGVPLGSIARMAKQAEEVTDEEREAACLVPG